MLRLFLQLASPARGLNEDPTVWLDGARLPSKIHLQVCEKSFVTKSYIFDIRFDDKPQGTLIEGEGSVQLTSSLR